MAYEIRIENSGRSLEEWVAFVESHPELTLVHYAEATNPSTGEVIRLETPNSAIGPNELHMGAAVHRGQLYIKVYGPDRWAIEYLKAIADEFGGNVVGEEGEEY